MSNDASRTSDYSMLSRRWNGDKLISSEIAVEIARLVRKKQLGQAAQQRDEPLSAQDDGDTWVVVGANPENHDPANLALDGPLRMRISKFDGQILSYVLSVRLPRQGLPPDPDKG
jgi:NTF2 fold immunity protein of polymorphic toxin system component